MMCGRGGEVALEADEVNFEEVRRGCQESHLLRAQGAAQLLLQM
jgi:hypothetical protein